MIKERKATYEEIQQLKKDKLLELPWDCEEGDFLFLAEIDNCVCAAIRLSIDPINNSVTWIDEFEVVKEYRKQKIGKTIICGFLKDWGSTVQIMAKTKTVAEFWYKCRFQYDNASWDEIPMVYSAQR